MPQASACSIPPELKAKTPNVPPPSLPSMVRLIFSVCRIPGI